MNKWGQTYGAQGFYMLLDADDPTSDIENYLTANNLRDCSAYCRNGAPFGGHWNDYGYANGYPYNVLMDRDGNVRMRKSGAIMVDTNPSLAQWEQAIKELVGAI